GRAHRHVGVELRPLAGRALPRRHEPGPAARPLHAPLRHRRAERQLLPVAEERDVRRLAPPAPAGLRHVGEGAARSDPREAALRPGDLARADDGVLARARRATGGAPRAAASRPRARRRPPRLVPRPGAALDAGRRGAAAPHVAERRGVRAPRAARRGVLRGEWRRPAVRAPRHRTVRLRAAARAEPRPPVRRQLLRGRPVVVGRPGPGVAGDGPRRLRLLQQRRSRSRRPQRGPAEGARRGRV
ncbi:MAG: FIG003003: hypothetical protein, partial [uncultured Nocardioidaceae bacterium]